MTNHIAIPLDRTTQIDSFSAYLRSIARPGTKIVFLIAAKSRKAIWMQAQMTALSTHHSVAVEVFEQWWRFEMDHEKRAAEQKLAALRGILLAYGVETEVHIFVDPVKKALRGLGANRHNSLTVLYPRKKFFAAKIARALLTRLGMPFADGVAKASLAFISASTPLS